MSARAAIAQSIPRSATVAVLGERLVVWRSNDNIVALEDRCVHRAAAFSLGRCEGANLRCMYHGLLFDSAGKVQEIPGQESTPPQAKVRASSKARRIEDEIETASTDVNQARA